MQIVDDLNKSRTNLLESIDGLTEEEMIRESTIGKWSARDVVLHVAMWEGEVLKLFAIWRTGNEIDFSYAKEYLKFNELWYESMKHLSYEQVLKLYNATHEALIMDVSAVPADVWNKRGGPPKWLSGVVIEHNGWHTAKLKEYKDSLRK